MFYSRRTIYLRNKFHVKLAAFFFLTFCVHLIFPQTSKAQKPARIKAVPKTADKKAGATSKLSLPDGLEIKFVYIPAGEFEMGSENGEADEKPVHRVKISRGFEIGQTEVTQAQWRTVMGDNPSFFKDCAECPVEQVSWEDVQLFVAKLNKLDDGHKYRLPTEAEWEYAARAGTTGDFAGDLNETAWYFKNSGDKFLDEEWSSDHLRSNNNRTHPVGLKKPNNWNLYDMHGNVWEWCADFYGADYYAKSPAVDPPGPDTGTSRILRGGSWSFTAYNLRSSFRYRSFPSSKLKGFGFRLVRQN